MNHNLIGFSLCVTVVIAILVISICMATEFNPLRRKKVSESIAPDPKGAKTNKGLYYVIVKGEWSKRNHYTDLAGAEQFAANMAKRGYDCEVIILVSRYDYVYAVDRTGYGE